jgi:CRISPR/Cas system-associated exonuclease Cas4 (RecB family)
MIRIIDHDDTLSIACSVSEFVFCMEYCEFKIPFYIGGIKAPKHIESELRKAEGKSGHEQEEKIEIKKIEKGEIELLTKEEMITRLPDINANITFNREDIITKLFYKTKIDARDIDLILTGRADKVLREDGYLIVHEDKFPRNPLDYKRKSAPFNSQILQALIYLNSKFKKIATMEDMWTCQDIQNLININKSFEIPHNNKKWIINIRDKNAEVDNNIVKTFDGIQTDQDRIYLEGNLYRFIGLVLGKSEKIHHGNTRKCVPCEYASICRFSL